MQIRLWIVIAIKQIVISVFWTDCPPQEGTSYKNVTDNMYQEKKEDYFTFTELAFAET